LVVMKPCAHVTCKTCTDSLVRPAKQCIVCDKQLKEKDIVEIKREGELHIFLLRFHLLIDFSFFKVLDLQAGGWQRRQRWE
jgi:hypothetical protein